MLFRSYKELPCYQGATEKQKQRLYGEPYFNLDVLPSEVMRQEMEQFIQRRGMEVSLYTIQKDKACYVQLTIFLKEKAGRSKSFKDQEQEKWIRLLKAWMVEKGMPMTTEGRSAYGTVSIKSAPLLQYFNRLLKFLESEEEKDESFLYNIKCKGS